VNGLDLGVVFQSVGAELAAHAGLLEAAEGSLVVDQVVVVDPYGTGLDGVGDTDGGVDVLGVDGGSKTWVGLVPHSERRMERGLP